MKKIVFPLIGFIIGLFLYIYRPFFYDQFLERLNDYKYSKYYKLHPRKLSKDVLLVAIDEKSVNLLGRWPWDRKVFAKLLKKLYMAKAVAFDGVFSEPTPSDEYLADAIDEVGNFIQGYAFRDDSTQKIDPDLYDILTDTRNLIFRFEVSKEDKEEPLIVKLREKLNKDVYNRFFMKDYSGVEPPVLPIAEVATMLGYFNAAVSVDGYFRRYNLVSTFNRLLFASLGLQMYRYYLGKDVEFLLSKNQDKILGIKVYSGKKYHPISANFRVNFKYKYRVIPIIDILKGIYKPDYFKDKFIFIGATELGVYDMRPTPINTVAPGVLLHMTAFDNLREKCYFIENEDFDVKILLILGFITLIILFVENLYVRLLLYAILVYGYLKFSMYVLETKHIWMYDTEILIAISLEILFGEFYLFYFVSSQAKQVKKSFESYLSPVLVNELIKNPNRLQLGGEERKVSILFSDIRSFTTISEALKPDELVKMLNTYLDPMTKIILNNKGLLDKYIGDAIMAIFNAPLDIGRHEYLACKSAVEMLENLKNVNEELEKLGLPGVNIGIGINTGLAVVGNVGSSIRFDYTAIGDTVNLASRLEGLTKYYSVKIVVSQFTRENVNEFKFRLLDKVRVKGKKEGIKIYELNNSLSQELIDEFEMALNLYFEGKFTEAKKIFKKLYKNFNDLTSKMFIERCERLANMHLENWDGIYTMTSK